MTMVWCKRKYHWEMEYLTYVDLCRDTVPLSYEEWRRNVDASLVEGQEG